MKTSQGAGEQRKDNHQQSVGGRKANGQEVLGLAELSPDPIMGRAKKQNLQRLRAMGQVTVSQKKRQLGVVMICLKTLRSWMVAHSRSLDGGSPWKGILQGG